MAGRPKIFLEGIFTVESREGKVEWVGWVETFFFTAPRGDFICGFMRQSLRVEAMLQVACSAANSMPGEEDLSESACNAMLSSLFAPARAVP